MTDGACAPEPPDHSNLQRRITQISSQAQTRNWRARLLYNVPSDRHLMNGSG